MIINEILKGRFTIINIKVTLIVNLEIFLDLPGQKINSSVVKFAIIRKIHFIVQPLTRYL